MLMGLGGYPVTHPSRASHAKSDVPLLLPAAIHPNALISIRKGSPDLILTHCWTAGSVRCEACRVSDLAVPKGLSCLSAYRASRPFVPRGLTGSKRIGRFRVKYFVFLHVITLNRYRAATVMPLSKSPASSHSTWKNWFECIRILASERSIDVINSIQKPRYFRMWSLDGIGLWECRVYVEDMHDVIVEAVPKLGQKVRNVEGRSGRTYLVSLTHTEASPPNTNLRTGTMSTRFLHGMGRRVSLWVKMQWVRSPSAPWPG
jgi:hypothetical protein